MIKTPEEIRRLREKIPLRQEEWVIHTMLRACRPRVTDRTRRKKIYKGEIAKAGGQVYWMHMAVTRGKNSR